MSAMFNEIGILLVVCFCSQVWAYPYDQNTGWTNKKAEIYFLLDSSASVWIVDYRKQLQFVSDLIEDMDIGPSATRVGVGVFSENHYLYIGINNTRGKESLQSAVKETPYLKGNTYISRALKGMREQGLAAGLTRPGVPLIGVLLTDGQSRHKQLTADNATLAKREGIFLFTIGIGNDVDREELRAIASDPKADFTFNVADYDHLTDIRAELSRKMSEVDFLQGDKGSCGENTLVDTVFVYDEAALGDEDTQKVKFFLKSLAEDFSMNSGHVRVGVVSKTCHEGDIMLGQYVTKEDFVAGLEKDEGPDISLLVKRARLDAFLPNQGARIDAKKRIVLILHAAVPVEKQPDILMEVFRARHVGIQIFVIRIGTDYNKQFINSLASDSTKAFYVDSPDHLSQQKDKFLPVFCQDL